MRNMGTGRVKPLTGYGDNHREVHTVLSNARSGGLHQTSGYTPVAMGEWQTPASIRGYLNAHGVRRKGARSMWYDADVQNLLSDLVGWGYAEMRRAPKGRHYIYRFVKHKGPSQEEFVKSTMAPINMVRALDAAGVKFLAPDEKVDMGPFFR